MMRRYLSDLLRTAGREFTTLRGEVITAVAVAVGIAMLTNNVASVVLGLIALATVLIGALAVSNRIRATNSTIPTSETEPSAKPQSESTHDPRIAMAHARLQEVARDLDLVFPHADASDSESTDFMPLVSVIVPCFNDAAFVEEALESVRRQTYERWECVVIDDASTDGSWDLILSSVGDDQRFKSVRLDTNSGSGAARNRGVAEANGAYIAFLDSDDLLLVGSIEDRVRTLASHTDDAAIVGSFCAVRSSPQDVSLDELPARRHATQPRFMDFVSAGGECPFTLHAPLVSRQVLQSLGGFDESMTTGAVDWDFWYRILRNGYVFVPSRTLGAIYRQKEGGITRSNKPSHTRASAKLIRAAFDSVDPDIIVSPAAFPMPEPLAHYEAAITVADRAVRFAAMALAEGDRSAMQETLLVLEPETWPLLDRHIEWDAVVGRGLARVVGLRPKDVDQIADVMPPYVDTIRAAAREITL